MGGQVDKRDEVSTGAGRRDVWGTGGADLKRQGPRVLVPPRAGAKILYQRW